VMPSCPAPVGTVLRSGRVADRFLLSDQFLHKSLMLVVHELPSGIAVAAVLNRPTANLVQFHTDGKPRRCINFGGDGRLVGDPLEVDANGLLWLARSGGASAAASLGSAVGTSGLRRVNALEAAQVIRDGEAQLSDFLLVSGVVAFSASEMDAMLTKGELCVIDGREAASIWPQLFQLADAVSVDEDDDSDAPTPSDGTAIWWASSQLGKTQDGLQPLAPTSLADEALDEWLRFFAGHKESLED